MTLKTPIVKDRILLHLLDFEKSAGAYDVPPDVTQDGIAQATWIAAQHVLQYARPLIAEGLVRERMAHVRDSRRRRKVYELTETGRVRARAVRADLAEEMVLARTAAGLQETSVTNVLRDGRGEWSLLDIIREFHHAGAVDLSAPRARPSAAPVRFFADAPSIGEFVGRERELHAIVKGDDLPRIFVVRGVAGIGKSTLAAKACDLLPDHHLLWHRVRPWDTPQSILASMAAFLGALGKPALRNTLSEGQIHAAFRTLQADLAGLRAFVVLDDAHEAGEGLLPFLRFLKDAVAQIPSIRLLVITRRSLRFYDRRDVVLNGLVKEIDLAGLDEREVNALTPSGERLPGGLGGHPLLLKLYRAARGAAVPSRAFTDIQRFIEESISNELTDAERQVMKLASRYRVPMPEAAFLSDSTFSTDILRPLADRTLLTPVADGNLEVHEALRAFFAALLTERERTELGRLMAHHLYARAKEKEKSGELSAAVACLFNAIEVAPVDSEMVALAELLGDLQERIGDFAASSTSYRRGIELTAESVARARLHRKLGSIRLLQGRLPEADVEIEDGFRSLEAGGNGERGWLLLARCRLAIRKEEWEEALQDGQAAMGFFQAAGTSRGQAEALYQTAHAEVHRPAGNFRLAQEGLNRALTLAAVSEDPRLRATIEAELAYISVYRIGDAESALKHLELAESLLDASEISYQRANFRMLRGLIDLWLVADLTQAESDFQEALELGQKLDSDGIRAYAGYSLAQIAFFQGRLQEAAKAFESMARKFEAMGAWPSALDAISTAAECALMEGNTFEFSRLVEGMRKSGPSSGTEARPLQRTTLEALHDFLAGDRDGAIRRLEEALGRLQGAVASEAWYPLFIRSLLLEASGRAEEAARDRKAAAQTLREFSRMAELASLSQRSERLLATLKGADGDRPGDSRLRR